MVGVSRLRSTVLDALKKVQKKATGPQMLANLQKAGARPLELSDSGLSSYLMEAGPVNAGDVESFMVDRRQLMPTETVKNEMGREYDEYGDELDDMSEEEFLGMGAPGSVNNTTQYYDYSLGTNPDRYFGPSAADTYREILLQQPPLSPDLKYKSDHWEEDNPVLHLRMQELQTPHSGQATNIDELQSDWRTDLSMQRPYLEEMEKELGFPVSPDDIIHGLDAKREAGAEKWRKTFTENFSPEEVEAFRSKFDGQPIPSQFSSGRPNAAVEDSKAYQQALYEWQDKIYADPVLKRYADMMTKLTGNEEFGNLNYWGTATSALTNLGGILNPNDQSFYRSMYQGYNPDKNGWRIKTPLMPHASNTTDLGIRRALIEAAENKSPLLTWTPGNLQIDRYGLSAPEQIRNKLSYYGGIYHGPEGIVGAQPWEKKNAIASSRAFKQLGLTPEPITVSASPPYPDSRNPVRNQQFPGVRLSPELRDKILKEGLPLYGAAGAAIGAGSMLSPEQAEADVGGYKPVAPGRGWLMDYVADPIRAVGKDPLGQLVAPAGVADLAEKVAYDDERSYIDYLLASLDLL